MYGNNPNGLQGCAGRVLRRSVSAIKAGVMWAYLNIPRAVYIVKPCRGAIELKITRCPRLI